MEGFVGQERVVVLVAFCLLIRQISSFRRELTETSRPRHFRDTFAERAHTRRLFGETTRQAGRVAPSILDGACMFSPLDRWVGLVCTRGGAIPQSFLQWAASSEKHTNLEIAFGR